MRGLIFWSRWLQAPLYLGLIVAQGVYVYHFGLELLHLFQLDLSPAGESSTIANASSETKVMLIVLTLIDVVMIANLLVMVIIGGYETFVSRLHLKGHPDQPEWLSQVNAAMLKVKLAMALIGISSIHLLRTFILAPDMKSETIMWQVIIHITFLLSAIALAYTDRLMHPIAHNQNTDDK